MKEYKIMTAKSPEEAERLMNSMALQGWTVKAMTYWNVMTRRLLITFEKDA